MVGRELTFFPSHFSTLLYAYEKTNFVDFIHNIKLNGSTVFAPDNRAFEKLGAKANAFLFNTEKGRTILKALLKYQIVANVTLYSDEVYGNVDRVGAEGVDRHHYDLTTLLHDKHVSVDITRFGAFTSITVNGQVPVVARDAVAKNGVIQVVGKIPFPPHKHHDHDHDHDHDDHEEEGEIEVGDLIERLQDYVDEDDKQWVGEL
jgi:uncharacterized surface protein with fasciclin (FAS1) repeats